jgi:WD40 repeat protein
VATGSDNGKVLIWDAQSGVRKAALERAHSHHVFAVSFSPDEKKRLMSASLDGTVKIWDVSNLNDITLLRTLKHPRDVNIAAFSPDGKLIATGSDDGVTRIWDADTGERPLAQTPRHRHIVFGVAFSPDGSRLATASWDWNVKRRGTLTPPPCASSAAQGRSCGA